MGQGRPGTSTLLCMALDEGNVPTLPGNVSTMVPLHQHPDHIDDDLAMIPATCTPLHASPSSEGVGSLGRSLPAPTPSEVVGSLGLAFCQPSSSSPPSSEGVGGSREVAGNVCPSLATGACGPAGSATLSAADEAFFAASRREALLHESLATEAAAGTRAASATLAAAAWAYDAALDNPGG